MSKAYIVKDGIIIGETTARYSYEREDGAVVIKPLTKEEEERILKQSDLNKKIGEAIEAIRVYEKISRAQNTKTDTQDTDVQNLEDIDADIRKMALRRIAIENQMANVVARIIKADNDWKIEEKIDIPENFSDDINIKLKNSKGNKSVIIFSNSGEVKILCDFDDNDGSRSALQRLVVKALRSGGAKKRYGNL